MLAVSVDLTYYDAVLPPRDLTLPVILLSSYITNTEICHLIMMNVVNKERMTNTMFIVQVKHCYTFHTPTQHRIVPDKPRTTNTVGQDTSSQPR